MVYIGIKKFSNLIITPSQATPGSAGWDVYSPLTFSLYANGGIHILDLGFSLEIPANYYMSIVPRSSLGKKGILIPNSPATIDSDFRGSVRLIMQNNNNKDIIINKDERIAQLILQRYSEIEFVDKEEFEETLRGIGGFGSTGK